MSSSSYAPDEPAHIIRDEVAWLQGAFVSSLLCGVQITLSAMSFLAVLKQRLRHRIRIVFLVYIFLLSAVMTAGQQCNLLFVQMGFTEWRNFPGGPNGFLSHYHTMPSSLASTSLFVFANWMMEALMVWRCKVVCCTGDRPLWCGLVIPSVLLACEYVTGALYLHQLVHERHPLRYGIAYAGLSALLNVAVTVIIAGRLLYYRRCTVRLLGQGHGSHYSSAAAILIESASFYTCFLVLVIVFFTIGTPASTILQQAVAQVQAITSLLIIYRIARGKGWKPDACVSTGDWRGDLDAQVEHVEVHLETVADSQATRTDGGVHALSLLGKQGKMPTAETASSAAATLPQDEAV